MFVKSAKNSPTTELDVWIAWCAGGDHVAGASEEEVTERAEQELLGLMASCAKLTVTVPLPTVIEAKTNIKDQDAMALVFVTS